MLKLSFRNEAEMRQDTILTHCILNKEITNVRGIKGQLPTSYVPCKLCPVTETGRTNLMLLLTHTEQEESHAALQLQEITSLLMTQVSRESSTSSIDLKHTVLCKCTSSLCNTSHHSRAFRATHIVFVLFCAIHNKKKKIKCVLL